MTTTNPNTGQMVVGVVGVTIAIAAAIIGGMINFSYGWQISTPTAATFVLADITKIAIPLGAGFIGWRTSLRLTYAVCLICSVACASLYYYTADRQHSLDRSASSASYSSAQADIERYQRDLAQITETATAASLGALVKAADAKSSREEKRGGCGPDCEQAKTEAAQIRERLGQAERRDNLERKLETLKASAQNSDGPKVELPYQVALLMTVIKIVLLELIVYLGHASMVTLRSAMAAAPSMKEATQEPKAETSAKVTERKKPKTEEKATVKKPEPEANPPIKRARTVRQKKTQQPANFGSNVVFLGMPKNDNMKVKA